VFVRGLNSLFKIKKSASAFPEFADADFIRLSKVRYFIKTPRTSLLPILPNEI
jgi:hypothetical protein